MPGQRAGYHPTSAWFILGEIVRRVDGRPFARYVREAIFAPLGMHDCFIGMGGADFEQTDRGHMGASNLWNIQCLCDDEDPLSSELAATSFESAVAIAFWGDVPT